MDPSAADSQPPGASRFGSPPAEPRQKKRVSSACQRCRQQKLKCDVHRPCTLCLRAGATCSAIVRPTLWKSHHPDQSPRPRRTSQESPAELPAAKRPRRVDHTPSSATPAAATTADVGVQHRRSTTRGESPSQSRVADSSPWAPSSAAVQFMEEAFHQHDTTSPGGPETSAFSASHWIQEKDTTTNSGSAMDVSASSSAALPSDPRQKRAHNTSQSIASQHLRRLGHHEMGSPAEAELVALLPPLAPATLLVDNYFERVHWFMLVFHQSEFKENLRELYKSLEESLQQQPTTLGLGFISVFAAACIVSLRYIDNRQRSQLNEYGIQPDVLQQKLLSTVRLRLLYIVSRGSIEAVQVCVLLGSFHLYHGEPELAWPICGCGLRIAQALNLHRRRPQTDGHSPPDLDDPRQRAEETRKRCWWAVYEIETTCSMLYGFPLSINDDDCDAQLLNPYPVRSGDASWDSVTRQETGQATLLSYKHAMAQLSIVVKSVLTDLYGLRRRRVPTSGNSCTADRHRLHSLMASVKSLDKRLHEWHARLPRQLRPASLNDAEDRPLEPFSKFDGADGLASKAFQCHLFQLQALALKVAFENAKILIHRPLLSYRMIVQPTANTGTTIPTTPDTCQSSIKVCRDAALEISNIGSLPVFQGVADTYAVSFVSLHLLTAAIALSILTTLTPLTQESHDCKMGIRRLMEMQSRLKARSIVADQGLGILKKLMALVLKKEMKEMFEFPRSADEVQAPAEDEAIGDDNVNRPSQANENGRALSVHGQAENGTHLEACRMRSYTDGQSADLIPIDSSTLFISDPGPGASAATTPGFSFYEDPIITQVLLDFEEVVSNTTDDLAKGTMSPGTQFSTGSCFSIQDQSWIWGSNHY